MPLTATRSLGSVHNTICFSKARGRYVSSIPVQSAIMSANSPSSNNGRSRAGIPATDPDESLTSMMINAAAAMKITLGAFIVRKR